MVRPAEMSASADIGPETPGLYWDSPYAIVLALMARFPATSPLDVGLEELLELVLALPGFADDPGLVNERFLLDIQATWYEEVTSA
jgi:FeS assembly protein IscX